jgi:dienelactone hydrolase
MTLHLPDRRQDRHPAIVIVHTIAGYQEPNEGWHANEFRKALHQPCRGAVAGRRWHQGWPSAVAEAYAALRFLADHPRIDADRIAIVGFSFGGEVAHLAAMERLRAALASDRQRFAAHVAYYPAGVHAAMAERGAYTGAPDPDAAGRRGRQPADCQGAGYLAYAQSAGAPPAVEVSIYRGAYHAWTVSSLGPPTFYPQYRSMRKCPYLLVGAAAPGHADRWPRTADRT